MYKTTPKMWEHTCFWFLTVVMGLAITSKEIWLEEGIIIKCGIISFWIFLVFAFLELYVTYTAFLENQIIHRSMLGKEICREYNQIERLYLGFSYYLIIFQDGLSIKIPNNRAEFIKISNLINEKLGRKIDYDTFLDKPKIGSKISSFKTVQFLFNDEKTKRDFFHNLH